MGCTNSMEVVLERHEGYALANGQKRQASGNGFQYIATQAFV